MEEEIKQEQLTDAAPANSDKNVDLYNFQELLNSRYLPDPTNVDYYRDQSNRVIWILEEVGPEAYDWVDFILNVNRQDRNIPVEERKPIKLMISNNGGSLTMARMLIDIIRLSKTPVYGYAIGRCASAASMIFLACHKRYALPHVTFLFHKGSCSNLSGSYSEIASFMDSYAHEVDELVEFYKTYTNYDATELEENLNSGDWYIYLDEAVEHNVVTDLVESIEDLL